jgi:hypothetical protein
MVITMGNDEFILYIRKNNPDCQIQNDQLGKMIWQWLEKYGQEGSDPSPKIVERDQPCQWGNSAEITSELSLPKSAAQFEFSIEKLPQLYTLLGDID